jgi:hypothetical protein
MTVNDILLELTNERKVVMEKLRAIFSQSIGAGFEECVQYKMISWSVPPSLYPQGYHCDPKQMLPFLSIASQKNFISVYHMGMYAKPELLNWFIEEFQNHSSAKLDIGKSCIRFKKMDDIPYDLLAELAKKMTAQEWISLYDSLYRKK